MESTTSLNSKSEPRRSNGRDSLEDTGRQAKQAVNSAVEKTQQKVSSVGERLSEFAESVKDALPQSETLNEATGALVETLKNGGEYLRTHDIDEMSEDATRAIQRHPVASVCIGIGIGFLLGKMLMNNHN